MAALLVRDARPFDVVVTTNIYGDILYVRRHSSDESPEIAGSLGLAASLNAGAEHTVAQAQHGSAPDIAGKNIADPASLIGSAAMLLAWLGERRADKKLDVPRRRSTPRSTASSPSRTGRTPDMGGSSRHRCLRAARRAGGGMTGGQTPVTVGNKFASIGPKTRTPPCQAQNSTTSSRPPRARSRCRSSRNGSRAIKANLAGDAEASPVWSRSSRCRTRPSRRRCSRRDAWHATCHGRARPRSRSAVARGRGAAR